MRLFSEMRERLRALFFRSREEREMKEELRFHLELEAERLVREEGLSEEQARRRARLKFGGVERFKEEVRDARGVKWLEDLAQDVGHTLRQLRRNPGFATAAVLTLALGIGMGTAVFSVVDAVLLQPPAAQNPDRVLVAWAESPRSGPDHLPLSYAEFREYERVSRVFEALSAVDYNGAWPRAIETDRGEGKANVALVSGGLFRVLGAPAPLLGRGLQLPDGRPDAPPVAVISEGMWDRWFGRDPAVLGTMLGFFGREVEIVGVMPGRFSYPQGTDVWAPMVPIAASPGEDDSWVYVHLVGRLRPGVAPAAARSELNAFLHREDAPYPPALKQDLRPAAESLQERITAPVRPLILLLTAGVALLFLVTSATVANLVLMRSGARIHEFGVRRALGAGRSRLVRQVLAEGLALSVLGGLLGLGLGYVAVEAFVAFAPAGFPRLEGVRLSGRVLAFAAGLSVLAAFLSGLTPAFWSAGAATGWRLAHGGGRTGTSTTGIQRARRAFVVLEMALAVVVLAGAGLLVRSLMRLQQVELGFAHENVLVVELAVANEATPTRAEYHDALRRIVERVQALPGVGAAAPAALPPFTGTSGLDVAYVAEGGEQAEPSSESMLNLLPAAPSYFRTLEIPLVRGRDFTDDDGEDAPLVVVLSQGAARRIWPGEDPIGRRIRIGGPEGPWRTIVGVVGDTRYRNYAEIHPTVYVPPSQLQGAGLVYLMVRGHSEATGLAPSVRRAVDETIPWMRVPEIGTVRGMAAGPLARPRMGAALMSGFAIAALLLCALGLYGIMAAYVRQHQREIGIRMALGADSGGVAALVLVRGMRLAFAGVILGLVAALAGSRVLRSLLFEVDPADPEVLLGTALLLLAIALIAVVAPVRRAIRIQPSEAIRVE